MGRSSKPVALTIAGSDSGGGAGIAADLKTFAAMGVHGALAITSVTAQNTAEVRGVYDLPPKAVVEQISAVHDDMGVDAAKTGMLSNADIIRAVASAVKGYGLPLVVDPVMISKSGAPLLREDAISALMDDLIPLATLVTPNAPEAERLTGTLVSDLDGARRAAKALVDMGAEAALVKGGHLAGPESIDVLYYDGSFEELRAPRIESKNTHGTGCTLSAAIAAGLAKGMGLMDSVRAGKQMITMAIQFGLELGKGHGPVNPTAWVEVPAERYRALSELRAALDALKDNETFVSKLVPEISMNLGLSLPAPYAVGVGDVAAVVGRIGRFGDRLVYRGEVNFGASSHVASAILTASGRFPEIRAAANIALNEKIMATVESLGLSTSKYDRREEPPAVKVTEGGSIPWGISSALKGLNSPPDVIYDPGDFGKEPGAFVFGRTASEVASKVVAIGKVLAGSRQ